MLSRFRVRRKAEEYRTIIFYYLYALQIDIQLFMVTVTFNYCGLKWEGQYY